MLGATTAPAFANSAGHIPEQVWDQPGIAALQLVYGGPSGSAAPLGWAHGEYIKLARSIADGRIYDLPRQAADRYLRDRTLPRITTWRVGDPAVPTVGALRVACSSPATVSWRTARDTGLGIYVVDLVGPRLWVAVHHAQARHGDGDELVFEQPT